MSSQETRPGFHGIASKYRNKAGLGPNDQRHQICKPIFQSGKRMFTVFLNHQGLVAFAVLPANSTITESHYAETVLPKIVQEIRSQRPITITQNVLLHDNASPHKTRAITQYLEGQKIQVSPHPPYSPDLAPCDFWLLSLSKDILAERKLSRVQDLDKAVNSEMKTTPKEEYHKAFSSWLMRLQHCINVEGVYFEGML